MLLVDYLEAAAAYLRERREKLRKTEAQYHRIYDPDLKREAAEIRREIKRKENETTMELLLNLEEFRALDKYFPDLLAAFMEDEDIGKVLSRKSWLLDFKNVPPEQAAAKLAQLRGWRAELKDARQFLKRWIGKVQARSFTATYPTLRGHLTSDMDKDEALEVIKKVDKTLLREGWLVLITDSLIMIPLTKFTALIGQLAMEELKASTELRRSMGRGTVAETVATRKLREVRSKKEHYERMVCQILLSNPAFLKSLKKKKNWLDKSKTSGLERFAQSVTPHSLKERAWLNDMRKKIDEKG